MIWRIALILSAIVLAFGILFTSVLKSATVRYSFSETVASDEILNTKVLGEADQIEIAYFLPYPGRILPDHPLWPLKALRDKLWLFVTTNTGRKSELKLLFADKRLAMSQALFEKDKPEIAYSTLERAEKYLQEASEQEEANRKEELDTKECLDKLAKAALKHRQVMEEILLIAPEDAKPKIIATADIAISVYEKKRVAILEAGMIPPESPFDRD